MFLFLSLQIQFRIMYCSIKESQKIGFRNLIEREKKMNHKLWNIFFFLNIKPLMFCTWKIVCTILISFFHFYFEQYIVHGCKIYEAKEVYVKLFDWFFFVWFGKITLWTTTKKHTHKKNVIEMILNDFITTFEASWVE